MSSFKAIVIRKGDSGQSVALTDFAEQDLMDGDVTFRVEWSTLNYKDGLAVTGKAPVVRRFPMIPGIDGAGTVTASSHPDWKPGDKVILNGWGCGETHLGMYGALARVKGDWLVPLPDGLSRAGRHGDRDRRLHRHAVCPGAGAAWAHPGERADRGDRGGGWGRLGRDRAPGQARLHGDRRDRAAAGGRLPQGARCFGNYSSR